MCVAKETAHATMGLLSRLDNGAGIYMYMYRVRLKTSQKESGFHHRKTTHEPHSQPPPNTLVHHPGTLTIPNLLHLLVARNTSQSVDT